MPEENKFAHLIFEAGFLRKIRRSQKKNNQTTVAEHTYRVTVIGFLLAKMSNANLEKIMTMCLFHDLPEARVNDLDVVARKYGQVDEKKAFHQQIENFSFNSRLKSLYQEYENHTTLESRLTHEADILEELATEKEQYDAGDKRALEWMKYTYKRLQTTVGQTVGKQIIKTNSDEWWQRIC